MSKTAIEWTEHSWNPIRGCSVVSDGCKHCYAMRQAARFSGSGQPYEGLAYRNSSGAHWTGEVRLIEESLEDPLRRKKPTRYFVNSMSDLFHESLPDEHIDRIFAVMAMCPQHAFQCLTKRPERMLEYLRLETGVAGRVGEAIQPLRTDDRAVGPPPHGEPGTHWWPLPNVWLGVSVEDQPTADERIPLLLQCPAAVRWISAEPLLGPVSLRWLRAWVDDRHGRPTFLNPDAETTDHLDGLRKLDWVVVGGESGPGARPMHPDWPRSLRDQCQEAGVPFFFKQWGSWAEFVDNGPIDGDRRLRYVGYDGKIRPADMEDERDYCMGRVGKKQAGRFLDGREWNEYPKAVQ